MKTFKSIALLVAGLIGMSSPLFSQTIINVDFNTSSPNYSGLGAASDSPANTLWNSFTVTTGDSSISNLAASDGTATGVDLTLENVGFVFDGVTGGGTSPSNDLLRDFAIATGGGTSFFTISGLSAGGVYNIYLYGINGGYNSRGTSFTINSTTLSTVNTEANGATFTLGDNYVLFSNVTASLSGDISGSWTANSAVSGSYGVNNEGSFNGLQIVSVPEPSTWALLALGLGALVLLRSRVKEYHAATVALDFD